MIRLMNEDFEQAWLAAGRLPDMADTKMKALKKLLNPLRSALKEFEISEPVIEKLDSDDEDSYKPYILASTLEGTELVIEYHVWGDDGECYYVVFGEEYQEAKTIKDAIDSAISLINEFYSDEEFYDDEPVVGDDYGFDDDYDSWDYSHGRYGDVGAVW